MTDTVLIKDFTYPGHPDSAIGIRAALEKAKENRAKRILFGAGTFFLKSGIAINGEGILHDAGSSHEAQEKYCHIYLNGVPGLILEGAVDETGSPATTLAGFNDGSLHSFQPSILWCEDCESMSIKNLVFTRAPEFCSAGVVVQNENNRVRVEVFEGNQCHDDMGTYCMNRFHPETGALTGESVTYGNGAGSNWKKVGERCLELESNMVASKVCVGEHLSWHQGAKTDFQCYFARCHNITLNNIRVLNSNGFCILTENCINITADRVVVKPDGNRLATGPRDAWKIFKCGGNITVRDMYIEGVRMDGQNMHSNWLFFQEKLSQHEGLFFCKYTYAPILQGSLIEFYKETEMESRIVSWASDDGRKDGGHYYRVRFETEIPEYAEKGSLCAAVCWEPERYLCINSDFVNIAGAGHLVRYDNLTLLNCRYKNTMNPGILLGAELPTHAEGGHATNILIRWCEFDNCGFFPRYNTPGCIGINSNGFVGPYNKDIVICDNVFRNSEIGVYIADARDVYMFGNRFEGVEQPVVKDEATIN